jgi:hypothetical protein
LLLLPTDVLVDTLLVDVDNRRLEIFRIGPKPWNGICATLHLLSTMSPSRTKKPQLPLHTRRLRQAELPPTSRRPPRVATDPVYAYDIAPSRLHRSLRLDSPLDSWCCAFEILSNSFPRNVPSKSRIIVAPEPESCRSERARACAQPGRPLLDGRHSTGASPASPLLLLFEHLCFKPKPCAARRHGGARSGPYHPVRSRVPCAARIPPPAPSVAGCCRIEPAAAGADGASFAAVAAALLAHEPRVSLHAHELGPRLTGPCSASAARPVLQSVSRL